MFSLNVHYPFLNVFLGILLLFAGQRLFWLYISLLGFIFGFNVAEYYLQDYSTVLIYLAAIISGLVGVFIAVFLQRVAVVLAGVLTGIILGLEFYNSLMQESEIIMWAMFAIGGTAGGVVFGLFFNWALILFSAILGSTLIVQLLDVDIIIKNILFLVLLITGAFVQAKLLEKEKD